MLLFPHVLHLTGESGEHGAGHAQTTWLGVIGRLAHGILDHLNDHDVIIELVNVKGTHGGHLVHQGTLVTETDLLLGLVSEV